ncbi:hypothetical protein ABZT28_43720 [Streptomyces sp. NPDC005388]|uniref:hypothetical protein n=1 Tax=Streptomyces sp. NPDC005388 TaxID=3156717 RepID=UPI0033B816E2
MFAADTDAVHLLAAALHACQTVIAQHQVAAKSNEIPAFAPLLDRIDLRGVVVTADAMPHPASPRRARHRRWRVTPSRSHEFEALLSISGSLAPRSCGRI